MADVDDLRMWRERYHAGNSARQSLMLDIRLSWDSDQWGTVMMWWFAIAEVLYHENGDSPSAVPSAWQFRDGAGCPGIDPDSYPEAELAEGYRDGRFTTDALVYAGTILTRYAHWLKAAGQDY